MTDEGNRRRHARHASHARVQVNGRTGMFVAPVIDLSAGGVLLELPDGTPVPLLGARARLVVALDHEHVARDGRVVRVRWAGRDRGAPLARACAWVFDDGDERGERRILQWLLAP